MKVATVSVAGERRVGQITKYETSIAPFDLAFSQVRDGILAVIRHKGAGMPPTPSAMSSGVPRRRFRCRGARSFAPPRTVTSTNSRAAASTPAAANGAVAGIMLQPGDVIATGTPAGVSIGFDPPKYLKAGDVMRIEIGSIGALKNEIVERTT